MRELTEREATVALRAGKRSLPDARLQNTLFVKTRHFYELNVLQEGAVKYRGWECHTLF